MGTRSPAVDAYLKHTPLAHRQALEVVRDLLHALQPEVRESVQYNMPLFEYHGMLCGFASQLQSASLYCKPEVVERYRDKLGKLIVGKGRIRFHKLDDLPLDTLRAIFSESCTLLRTQAIDRQS